MSDARGATEHVVTRVAREHVVMERTLKEISELTCTEKFIPAEEDDDGTPLDEVRWHDVTGDANDSNDASFEPDSCPVCKARKCLERIVDSRNAREATGG